MDRAEQVIAQTKKWINDVVIGCNFCPFAAKEVKKGSVYYRVVPETEPEECLESFLQECVRLDDDPEIETTLLIFPDGFNVFDEYLGLVSMAEELLAMNGYEGVYQVASFHPFYQFADSSQDDAANYTNRSVYPMLHLLREESITKALDNFPDAEQIPERNIRFAREKGMAFMKMLRDACL